MFFKKHLYFSLFLFIITTIGIDARRTPTKKKSLYRKKTSLLHSTSQTKIDTATTIHKYPVIIFDLTNVLFKENQMGFAHKLGYATLANYTLTHWKNPGYRCLDMLNTISANDQQKPRYCITLKGRTMPCCLVELQEGKKTCAETKNEIAQAIETLDKKGYFSSIKEKTLMLSIMNLILDPETVTTIIEPIKPMVALAQKLKADGYQILIFANAPGELFISLEKKHADIFGLFDGVVISSHVKAIKPDPAMFQHLLTTHNLNPKDCILIDDLEISIAAGKQLGIEGIVYDKISTVTQKLKKLGVAV